MPNMWSHPSSRSALSQHLGLLLCPPHLWDILEERLMVNQVCVFMLLSSLKREDQLKADPTYRLYTISFYKLMGS